MSKHAPRRARSRQIETLESRQVMSADPVTQLLGGSIQHQGFNDLIGEPPALVHQGQRDADFWMDSWSERDPDVLAGDIEQTLASAHASTGLTQVRNDYGFIGTGQTVAIIDSGIAWDHIALGGGFGANYRVVGGWDFTEENDAVPYDDGPSGSHGTHVAGIVGADRDGTNDDGVAPGADLVSLRVFNDQGEGYFSWVENALSWIHTNRNAFANPITAVNLSLGTAWNSTSIPAWSILEDELAQLKADGIFISVAAGNDYATYNAPGLSYPAVSPHVVPVMSVNDNGNLSGFSQRHTSAIAAPGRYIVSTVPDYVGNQNGINDDYASFSGTSMASPYIAGASVLVREAMEFVGYANITQDTIFDHLMSTATTFFDAATSQNYKRLNLTSALDALMPSDEYGSTIATAYNLGSLSGSSQIAGLIGKLSDVDYFTFTAAATGTVSFTADTTHGLAPVWTGNGGTGAVSGNNGETYTFEVDAGQSYSLGLATSGGIGYYNLSIETEAAFSYVDYGMIAQTYVSGMSNAGDSWYRVQSSQSGYFTAEALFAIADGNIHVDFYDSNMQLLANCSGTETGSRVDILANANSEYYICVSGTNANIDLRLTNLTSFDGSTFNVNGTGDDDVLSFTAGTESHVVTVNGATYEFSAADVDTINIGGGGGYDAITMIGTAGDETATLRSGTATLTGSGFAATATSVEHVLARSGGGNDTAIFYDSADNDVFRTWSKRATMTGDGIFNDARGFRQTVAYSDSGGYDRAFFYDSWKNNTYRAWSDRATMEATGRFDDALGFERTIAYANRGGYNQAIFYDSSGDDTYSAWTGGARMQGENFFNLARDFDRTTAYSTNGGYDQAIFHDSSGDDTFRAWSDRATMAADGSFNDARGFDRTTAYSANGGYDQAIFYDSPGDDVYRAWSDRATMAMSDCFNDAQGFDRTVAYATRGGYDQAILYDSPGDDVYQAWSDRATIGSDDYFNVALEFDRVVAYATRGGNDLAIFHDSAGNDIYRAWDDRATMATNKAYNVALGFERTEAHSTSGGYDRAFLYDTPGDDSLLADVWGARLSGAGFHNEAHAFDEIVAQMAGGNDQIDIGVVEYLFSLVGG